MGGRNEIIFCDSLLVDSSGWFFFAVFVFPFAGFAVCVLELIINSVLSLPSPAVIDLSTDVGRIKYSVPQWKVTV